MDYDAVLATEHVGRYTFAAPLCSGKRVLDVACGEGYGAFMLAKRGAAEVVGVDISEEAIGVAQQRFARDGIQFLAGDATDLSAVLRNRAPFDVVVSFETIEHVSDPRRFLDGVAAVLAPGGIVLLSCPNDAPESARGIINEFHLKTYTLAEFQRVTTSVLGVATGWYLGTPLLGTIVAEASSSLLVNESSDLSLLVDCQEEIPSSHLLPAQPNLRVTPDNCTFYLGIWGASGKTAQVAAAPMSKQSFLQPWLALEQIGELRRCKQETERTLVRLREETERALARLREIESSRGYWLLLRYYALAGAPVTGFLIQLLRKGAKHVLRLIGRLRVAS
jgi:ubiquinone/menaquinone biosynthesis C-methylase UbiE